jgi:hypothetical protein
MDILSLGQGLEKKMLFGFSLQTGYGASKHAIAEHGWKHILS